MVTRRRTRWSYARSGVDRSAVSRSLGALLAQVRYRPPPAHGRPIGPRGHYAGFVRIGRETIAATTDTVGTKVLLAEATGRWEEVGEDMVTINTNDLASVGARPFGLVDSISCAAPDPTVFAAIGRGLDRGLRAGRCALLGGETAIVPDLVKGFDLGGTALGFFPRRRRPILGSAIRRGDMLLGVPSSGVHSNGFTLVRRLLDARRANLRRPRDGGRRPLGVELLTPTRSYVPVSEALADLPGVHGFAHISGGGVRNLVRLGASLGFEFDDWPVSSSLFEWLRTLGPVSTDEMFQTFNMGIGFVVALAPAAERRAMRALHEAGVRDVARIGRVAGRPGVRVPAYGVDVVGYS